MKKLIAILFILFIGVSAFISPKKQLQVQSGITGIIEPADGAKKVWAIAGTDSIGVIPVNGKFSITVKPGNWTIVVEAVAPYQNATVEGVLVLEGNSTDAGTIKLPTK